MHCLSPRSGHLQPWHHPPQRLGPTRQHPEVASVPFFGFCSCSSHLSFIRSELDRVDGPDSLTILLGIDPHVCGFSQNGVVNQ